MPSGITATQRSDFSVRTGEKIQFIEKIKIKNMLTAFS